MDDALAGPGRDCIGCQVCAQECPTTRSPSRAASPRSRWPARHRPPCRRRTAAALDAPAPRRGAGEIPWGERDAWHVAERTSPGRLPHVARERRKTARALPGGVPRRHERSLYVSLIAEGRYDEALRVASEPNPFPCICGRICTAPCEDVCARRVRCPDRHSRSQAICHRQRFAMEAHRASAASPARGEGRHRRWRADGAQRGVYLRGAATA